MIIPITATFFSYAKQITHANTRCLLLSEELSLLSTS